MLGLLGGGGGGSSAKGPAAGRCMAGVGRQGRGGPGNGSDSDESSDLDMPAGRIHGPGLERAGRGMSVPRR